MRTFYEILGVSRNATQEEILSAYRKRCLETHPDRGGNDTDFLNVRKGYEILSNPEKRAEYDKWFKLKEDKEKKDKILFLRKKIEPWINSFLSQYCKDDFLKTLILTYFYGVDSIYKNVNETKNEIFITAEIIKNILIIIREDNTYNLESVLSIDSICNDVILGRKDIKGMQKEANKPEKKDDIITKIDKGTEKKIGNIAAWFVLALASGFVYLICSFSSQETKSQINEPIGIKKAQENKETLDNLKSDDRRDAEIEWLYNMFDEYGYTVGFFEDFKEALQEKETADWYYDNGKKDGIIDVDRKTFYKIVNSQNNHDGSGLYSSEDIHNYKETVYKTGDYPYLSWYGKGRKDSKSLSELEILNYSSTEAVVLLESIYGTVVRHVYIKDNSSYTIKNIPEGRYRMKVMYGNSWNNEKDNGSGYPKGGFMRNISFSKSKDNELFDFMFEKTYDGVSYPTYSVTLHKVANGNMQTESIDEDDFF